MTDQEWFAQIGICYDLRDDDDEDPLAIAKGTVNGVMCGATLWLILCAVGFGLIWVARNW